MSIAIRSEREVQRMLSAGRIVGNILQALADRAKPGVTTAELAEVSDRMIEQAGAIALFKGVPNPAAAFDFPSSICVSLNEQVVHGIPSERVLEDGDLVSVDCGVKLAGYCGDAAVTLMVGDVDDEDRALVTRTEEVLDIAVREMAPGKTWSSIAAAMQAHAESAGYGVVRDYVGHGIGRRMHEDPKLPNYVSAELKRSDIVLRKGMVFAVEPMVNAGTFRVRVLNDGWTVVTADAKKSAHVEHTIAVTDRGAQVLTLAG